MVDLFGDFRRKKKPLPKIVRMYEPEEEKFSDKIKTFPVFVGIGVVAVLLIVILIVCFNSSNNALKSFVTSSSNNFDSGSFSYSISATLNGEMQMQYNGSMEFDLNKQVMKSVYTAEYADYSYDAVVYSVGLESKRGNYYDGKWIVEDYSDRALDFFDFYRDYRKCDFDAGAALRFTGANTKFNAQEFEKSFNEITKTLTKPSNMDSILQLETNTNETGTIVTMIPNLELVFDIIVDEIGSAYLDANEYEQFVQMVEDSQFNLQNSRPLISYTITDNGYLSQILIDYTVDNNNYMIRVDMAEFGTAQVVIPDSFYDAASIEKE